MCRKSLFALAACAAFSALSTSATQAQDFPGLGVGDMWANELAFQNQFYQNAWRQSWELARQVPNDQPLPFNAMTISNSLNQGMQAFEGFANNWHVNSETTMNAIGRWNEGAIRGIAPHANPYGGPVYNLPYGPEGYHVSPAGYMHQGVNPYYPAGNYYPVYE